MLIKIKEEKAPGLPPLTKHQEAVLNAKIDRHFRSQRELKNGRNFRWDTLRFIQENEAAAYRNNFDKIKWREKPPAYGI